MKKLRCLIIAATFIAACNQKNNNLVATSICESCNVSIDSGDLKMYIPLSLIDTNFSVVYDTKFDEVFLIDSFYNKEHTLSIAIKRDADIHRGNIKEEDVIIKLSQNIHRIFQETNSSAEIFKADSIIFNENNRGGLISYLFGKDKNGLVIIVLHPDRGKWYTINIVYKDEAVKMHFMDSLSKIISSINTKR